MKKRAISAILLAFNICLVLAIFVLVIMIVKRGPKPMEDIAEAVRQEEIEAEQNIYEESDSGEESTPENEYTQTLVCIPNSTSPVNVRTGPGTEYERIGSAYSVNDYVVQAVLDNGWTLIEYDDTTGYISTEYINFQIKSVSNSTMIESFSDASDSDISPYRTSEYTVNTSTEIAGSIDYEQEANTESAGDEDELDEESQDIIDQVTGTEE